jgi:hypothetical protein
MPCFIYTYKTKLFFVKPFISLVWDSMICLKKKNHLQGHGIETFRQRRAQDARAAPGLITSVAVNCAISGVGNRGLELK